MLNCFTQQSIEAAKKHEQDPARQLPHSKGLQVYGPIMLKSQPKLIYPLPQKSTQVSNKLCNLLNISMELSTKYTQTLCFEK